MRSKKRKKRRNLTIFVKVIVIFFFLLTAFFVFKSIPKKEIKENKSIKKVLKKETKKEIFQFKLFKIIIYNHIYTKVTDKYINSIKRYSIYKSMENMCHH